MAKYLDSTGLSQVWTKAKNTFSPLSHSHKYISATSITTDSSIVQEDLRVYYGSGGDWTGSVSSMAYAAILTIGYPNRGWQAWAARGDGDGGGMYWRRGLQDSSDWNTPRLFLDSSNYTGYTVTKTGSGASGTWSINITGSAGSVDWSNVGNKPSTYTPATHNHDDAYLKLSGGSLTGALNLTYAGLTPLLFNNSGTGLIGVSYGAFCLKIKNVDGNGNAVADKDINLYLGSNEYKVWHAGNDGSGSGLDADLLDGQHASAFATSSHNHDSSYLKLSGGSLSGNLTITGYTYLAQGKPVYFRDPNTEAWRGGFFWGTAGSEAMAFVAKSSGTRFIFVGNQDISTWSYDTWQGITEPYMSVSSNVGIGTLTPSYKLHVNGSCCSSGFVKSGSSNSEVLLGGGGSKSESSLSVSYATSSGNADTLDGYHENAFYPGYEHSPFYISTYVDYDENRSWHKAITITTTPVQYGGITVRGEIWWEPNNDKNCEVRKFPFCINISACGNQDHDPVLWIPRKLKDTVNCFRIIRTSEYNYEVQTQIPSSRWNEIRIIYQVSKKGGQVFTNHNPSVISTATAIAEFNCTTASILYEDYADAAYSASIATEATSTVNIKGGAKGSIPYQSASGTTSYVSIGSNGQVLSTNSSGLPAWTTPTVAWSNVSGKPSTFAPSSHTHDYIDVNGITTDGSITTSGLRAYSGVGGAWEGSVYSMAYAAILAFGNPSRGWQMWAPRAGSRGDGMYWRRGNSDANAWEDQRLFLDTVNHIALTNSEIDSIIT